MPSVDQEASGFLLLPKSCFERLPEQDGHQIVPDSYGRRNPVSGL